MKILAPGELVYSGSARVLTYPGVVGEAQVLPGHARMTAVAASGSVTVDDQRIEIERAVVSVTRNEVLVLVRKRKRRFESI